MHHTGFVVASIDNTIESFAASIGGRGWTQTWEDPIQRVSVAFIHPAREGDPSIELVAPADESAPVWKFMARGGGLHHICYEVEDIEAEVTAAPSRGSTVIRKPRPAVAFDGRRIAWVVTREKLLVEYLEAERAVTNA